MIRPQPEVAEVIRSCYDEFLERYGKGSRPSNGEPLTIWQGAARRLWVGTSWSARNAGIGRSPITPVAIAIAPSARPPPRPDGWRLKQPICCPCLTSMSSSRFPVILARSPFTIPAQFR